MNISIRFTRQTVKMLIRRMQYAYRVGDLRLVRRTSALLDLSRQVVTISEVAETYSVARPTVYDWLKALLCHGEDSLVYRRSPGRKPRLTKVQKQRLSALVQAGPQAAGFATACWTSLLIQQLIRRELGVLYNRYYVCELLRNLGFSVQKARFVSDHLDEEARQRWWSRLADVLSVGPNASFSLLRHLNLVFGHAFERLSIDADTIYTANLSQVKLVWNFNVRFFVRAIVQYQDLEQNPAMFEYPVDSQTPGLFTQFLFSYKLNPRTVFFLGYSDNGLGGTFDSSLGPTPVGITRTSRTFFLKIGYAWQL